MVRLVRLARRGQGPESVGMAVSPADYHKAKVGPNGETYEELGFKLDSYEDDKTPYEAPEAPEAPKASQPQADPSGPKKAP